MADIKTANMAEALARRIRDALGSFNDANECVSTLVSQVADRLRAAEERAEAVEKDAERYRWLRDADNYPDWDWWPNVLSDISTPEGFDAAIDDALAASENEGDTPR